jgi:hypothetical protein
MTRGRNLITTILLAAAILLISSRASEAQDQTPPPSMLLNLDLFTAQPGDRHTGQATGGPESTLEQLRALRSMGYLGADGPLPDDDDSDQPTSAPTQAMENSRGTQQ